MIEWPRGWRGFGWVCGLTWRGVGLQHTQGLYGSPVNRWSIKRTPNGTKLDGRSTGGKPRLLGNLGPIRECSTPAHEKRQKGTPEDIGAPECKTDNGENARMHETNKYANEMHMMT